MHDLSSTDNTVNPNYALISIINLFVAETIPLLSTLLFIVLHIHLPPVIMEVSQTLAWWVGITAGVLTIMIHFGFNPRQKLVKIKSWVMYKLTSIKNFFSKKP